MPGARRRDGKQATCETEPWSYLITHKIWSVSHKNGLNSMSITRQTYVSCGAWPTRVYICRRTVSVSNSSGSSDEMAQPSMAAQNLRYLWCRGKRGGENVPEMDYDCSTGLLPAAPSSCMQTGEAPPRKVSLTRKSLASGGQEPPGLPFWFGKSLC